jgi:phytanoyl-CoA hydroxylase
MAGFEKYRPAFDRDGFVIVPQLLGTTDFTEVCDNLDRYIRDVVPGLPDAGAFYQDRSRPETLKQLQQMTADPFFRDYVHHPQWKALAEDLLGEEARCVSPQWFNKPPHTKHPTPPHQDNYYFKLDPPLVLTIWLALDAIDPENGCLRYIRGSHLEGSRPHARSNVLGFSQGISDYGPVDEAREVAIELAPGDAVVHHGWLIHRADPNRSSTRHRRSFALVYRSLRCQPDAELLAQHASDVEVQHSKMGLRTK